MPGLDRTGPEGQGSRTGRQMGKCTKDDSGESGQGTPLEGRPGRGMGRGLGRGAGRAAGRAARRGQGNGTGRGRGRKTGQN